MSTILQLDDMNVGDFLTVHSCKHHNEPIPVGGIAFKVLAIEFPYLVGKIVMDPSHNPLTLDLRYLNLMRVSENYVKAQLPQVPQGMALTPFLEQLFRKS